MVPLLLLILACLGGALDLDVVEPVDLDGDGWDTETDCDDGDASVHPGAPEICNHRDDDCDGREDEAAVDTTDWYLDRDSDGWGTGVPQWACDRPGDHVHPSGDCDDANAAVFPGAVEVCNGVDDDCDGDTDSDAVDRVTASPDTDGDGYGAEAGAVDVCEVPSGWSSAGGDCDDTDPAYHPSATPGCDGQDYDCDGAVDGDGDGDGWPDRACGGQDCDDEDVSVFPGDGACGEGTDCLDIVGSGWSRGDGVYSIDPDGYAGGDAPFDAWCDMGTDGGGWTRVSTIYLDLVSCVFTAASRGDPSVGGVCTKYSDTTINDIAWDKIFYAQVGTYPPTYTRYDGEIRYNQPPGHVVQGDSLAAVQSETPTYTPGYSSWRYFHQQDWYEDDPCLGTSDDTARLSLEYVDSTGNLYACTGSCSTDCPTRVRGYTAEVFLR